MRVRLRRPSEVVLATTDAQGSYSMEVRSEVWTVSLVGTDSYVGGTDSVTIFVPPEETTTIEPFVLNRAVYDVEIQDGVFAPEIIRIGPGAIVRWTNLDADIHNIFFLPVGDPESEDLGTNEQFEWIFDTVGTYAYACQLHPDESGFVIVE